MVRSDVLRADQPPLVSRGSMLELSDIQTSQEELQDYYTQLRTQQVTPAELLLRRDHQPQTAS
jgi:hypothetical protein